MACLTERDKTLWWVNTFLKILFIQVLIMLYAKFQPSNMSVSGQKVCCGGGGGGGWVVETDYRVKLKLQLNLNKWKISIRLTSTVLITSFHKSFYNPSEILREQCWCKISCLAKG